MNLRNVGPGSWWVERPPAGVVLAFKCGRVDLYPYLDGIVAR